MAGGLELHDLYVPFQPLPFYDSVILYLFNEPFICQMKRRTPLSSKDDYICSDFLCASTGSTQIHFPKGLAEALTPAREIQEL